MFSQPRRKYKLHRPEIPVQSSTSHSTVTARKVDLSQKLIPGRDKRTKSISNKRSSNNSHYTNKPSHATLPNIPNFEGKSPRFTINNMSSRNPPPPHQNSRSEFSVDSGMLQLGLSIQNSKASLLQNMLGNGENRNTNLVRHNRVSFQMSPMAKYTKQKQTELYRIMQNCLESNLSYTRDLKMYEEARDNLHKYSEKIDYVRDSLKHLSFIDPKVIHDIYYHNKRDLKSREMEANRIAKEYKSGKVDPTGSLNPHVTRY